ncbi:MAG TPA: 6-carboxytetrahydropterin synthase, partial [Bacteroidia bacterium]|nr:6-carboxytetrahydropterin synthase [Bacteroidia bacterium]
GKPADKPGDPKNGMVIDFTDIGRVVRKNIIDVFDHALVLCQSDREHFPANELSGKVIYLPFPPTCEMLLLEFQRRLAAEENNFPVSGLRLDETATSFAEWHANGNL